MQESPQLHQENIFFYEFFEELNKFKIEMTWVLNGEINLRNKIRFKEDRNDYLLYMYQSRFCSYLEKFIFADVWFPYKRNKEVFEKEKDFSINKRICNYVVFNWLNASYVLSKMWRPSRLLLGKKTFWQSIWEQKRRLR